MIDSREIIDDNGQYRIVSVSIDSKVCGGEPCILSTRVTISNLLAALQSGLSIEECALEYELPTDRCIDALYWLRKKLGDANLKED